MSNKFSEFLEEVEAEARTEGPAAVAELAVFDERYRLAHQLMARRRELGLTQAKLARMTGIGQADISRMESARANSTVATLAAVAHALGLRLGLVPQESVPADRAGMSAVPAAANARRAPAPA